MNIHAILTVLAVWMMNFTPIQQPAGLVVPAISLPPVVAPSGVPPALDIRSLLGTSGNLRAYWHQPDEPLDVAIASLVAETEIGVPGIHGLGRVAPDGDSLVCMTLETFATSAPERYRTGHWPTTGLAAEDPSYAPPTGFLQVTEANQATAISKRFRLSDFLTHDQQDVWPKVLVLRPRLVDKLELIGQALDARGLPSRIHVMSGFRTPQYNALGVGEKGGRAAFSRHTYGDAADIWVDGDGDGRMDDLDHDGRVTVKDARLLLAVAEGVEAAHPELIGGLSAYRATAAHGPFVHVDARGKRARW